LGQELRVTRRQIKAELKEYINVQKPIVYKVLFSSLSFAIICNAYYAPPSLLKGFAFNLLPLNKKSYKCKWNCGNNKEQFNFASFVYSFIVLPMNSDRRLANTDLEVMLKM
jgi:hypothetical protein